MKVKLWWLLQQWVRKRDAIFFNGEKKRKLWEGFNHIVALALASGPTLSEGFRFQIVIAGGTNWFCLIAACSWWRRLGTSWSFPVGNYIAECTKVFEAECHFLVNDCATVVNSLFLQHPRLSCYNQCPQERRNYSNLRRKSSILANIKALFLVSSPAIINVSS